MKLFKRHKDDASASSEPPKEHYGLFLLDEKSDPDIDLVAVHGLGGHFEKTWTDSNNQKLWLRDFLPSQLHEAGIAARVMSYGYNSTTAFSKSITNIEDQATTLLGTLTSKRRLPSEKDRPLIFIAHSLGGIIVKKALIIAHERHSIYGPILDSARALVFFGVPHRGADVAYWSTFAASVSKTLQLGLGTNRSFVKALQKNSPSFAAISNSFIERAALLKIRTFYETDRLHGHVIVDKDSARLGFANETAVPLPDANHITICKFNDRNSHRYELVWTAIQALCVKTEGDIAPTVARKQTQPVFVVPFSKDPCFLGRENIIELLDTKFKSERRVALTGIGGVGKSQIAIEYCYRFRDRHANSNILWVHASTKERFEQAFKSIARRCKLHGWDDPAINALDLVYDWLTGNETWLMVLDNADDKDVFFDQRQTIEFQGSDSQRAPLVMYLPQTSRAGSILITSRNRDTAFRLTNSVESLADVPYMGKEDAIALLCKRLPEDHSSDDDRLELVELLDYLPLAITQAASYIAVKRTRMTISRYSDFLRKNENILLDDMGDLRRDPTIRNSVLLTWHISFEQISKENRAAAKLLSLMSVFDRQGIPQYLLQGEDEDGLDFERRLAPLVEFSLITLEDSGESFQMHRLVQMAIRSWLERQGEIDIWKQDAAELILGSLPSSEYQFWKTWETLLPHSEGALEYVLPNRDSQLLHARILHRTALYFEERGRYDAARERCQRALDIRLDVLGEDDPETAYSLVLLANSKRLNGYNGGHEIDEVEAMVRKALGIFERVQGKNSSDSLSARNDLASILLDTYHDRKKEEATEIFQEVLASSEQSLGLAHTDTLTFMNNLAFAFEKQHKYEESEKLHRRTLETKLRQLGEDDPRTITSMQNLSIVLFGQKRYEEVQVLSQRALDLTVRVLGEEHPNTVVSMARLARVLHVEGNYEQAERHYRKVYNNRPKQWDDASWDGFLADFAHTLAEQGKHDEAAEISRQRVYSKDPNSDHSEMSATKDHPRPRSASPPESPKEMPET